MSENAHTTSTTDWVERLVHAGLDPEALGGTEEARRALAATLADQDVLAEAPGGRARLSTGFAETLEHGIADAATHDDAALRRALRAGLQCPDGEVAHLLVHWASPVRVAAAVAVGSLPRVPSTVGLPAAELVARLWLLPWLQAVVEPGQEPGEATVQPEHLLELMLASGTLRERAVEQEAVLDLTPAFLAVRALRQEQARGWRAAERRARLAELLNLDGEALSEGYRLAGSGRTLGELLALHQFTALSDLGLWTAWQALASFARPFQPVGEDDLEAWSHGDVLLLVSSPSSRPALAMEELLTEALRSADVPVGVINADDERALCERLDVDRPPMVLLRREGRTVERIRWVHSPLELRDRIERFLDDPADPPIDTTTKESRHQGT